MKSSRYVPGALLALVSSLVAAQLGAQAQTSGPYRNRALSIDAPELAKRLREHRDPGPALHVLRQEAGPRPQHELDAIADTVTQIALTLPGDDFAAIMTRRTAVRVLRFAGERRDSVSHPDPRTRDGVEYAGAAGRLLLILETAPNPKTRHDALVALPDVLPQGELLGVLRKVAISQEPMAVTAIALLHRQTGPAGIEVLRELDREGLVTGIGAREYLERFALPRRWSGPDFPSGVDSQPPGRP